MAGVEYRQQNIALLRLQLYTVGAVTEAFGSAARKASALIVQRADRDGMVSDLELGIIRPRINRLIDDALGRWVAITRAARREAASLPFGTMRRMHARMMRGVPITEARARITQEDEEVDYVFQPQIASVMQAASRGFGRNWSDTIWRTSQQARGGASNVLYQGISQGKSAWDIARSLESFLGAGSDCPRWTRTRLFGLTKGDIADGNMAGLLSSSPVSQAMGASPCQPKGVSYNALRTARTEISRVHHEASQATYRDQPWVQEEQINLNPQHPVEDICDEIIRDGRDGKGIYPIGEVSLPIHPNCLCFSTAVTMQADDFDARMRGWLRGESWPDMDAYSAKYGRGMEPALTSSSASPPAGNVLAMPSGTRAIDALDAWLTGDQRTIDKRMDVDEEGA